MIIVDNVDRLVRSTEAYAQISAYASVLGVRIESPNHKFGDTPCDELHTDMLVCFATYHRKANRLQVIDRMNARLLNGYWTFRDPIGYKFVSGIANGKALVPDVPLSHFIKEALEGFASGRFGTQKSVADFLNANAPLEKKIHKTQIKRILQNLLYAGYLEYPKWGIDFRKAQHEPLISLSTYEKIQERLKDKSKAPYRKDLNEDFPLRGFALCASCNEPMTASWCKGRSKKYPYYHCKTKTCELYGKNIRKEDIESNFEALLKNLEPSEAVLELTESIIKDCWKGKKSQHAKTLVGLDRKVKELDQKIEGFMGRLLETDDKDMVKHYECYIKDLKMQREMLSAQSKEVYAVDTSYEGAVGTVFDFIRNPLSIWHNGDLKDKRMVLDMTFATRIPYDKKDGFGTASMSLPFRVLGDIANGKSKMVVGVGFEPTYS